MSCILNIETSTAVCSVAVSNDGECIFNAEDHDGPNHAVKLGTFVDEALPTLQLLCVPLLLREQITPDDALLCPMLDARRMEVYAALYDRALKEVRPVGADIVEADTYKAFLDQHHVFFFGNGADKCKAEIVHPNAHFIDNVKPLAKNMTPLAEKAMAEERFEDVAYFVPFYLKDFVAKAAKPLL